MTRNAVDKSDVIRVIGQKKCRFPFENRLPLNL